MAPCHQHCLGVDPGKVLGDGCLDGTLEGLQGTDPLRFDV